MLKKLSLTLLFLFSTMLLSACSQEKEFADVSFLPELFSVIPGDFDQLLFIEVDDDILQLLGTQYGQDTPVVDEFKNIEAIGIWQASGGDQGESMLFVQGDDVDINQLAALGLVALDPSYETMTLGEDIQIYGQTGIIQSKKYTGVLGDPLIHQYGLLYKKTPGNFGFISRPSTQGLAGLAVQFSQKLLGTTGVLSLGNKLPSGEARMLFGDGVVTSSDDPWKARAADPSVPVHIATHGITDLLGLDSTMAKTFLPLIASQYLGDGFSLLTDTDLEKIVAALGGSLSLDLVPSMLGMGGRLTLETPTVFDVVDTMYPVLDGAVKTQMFSGAAIQSIKEASLISWNTSVPIGSGADVSLPLISVQKGVETTTASFMLIEQLPTQDALETYPGSVLGVATVDFELLTGLMGVEAGEIIAGADTTSVNLEVIAVDTENVIRVVLK